MFGLKFKRNNQPEIAFIPGDSRKHLVKKRLAIIGSIILLLLLGLTIYKRYYLGTKPIANLKAEITKPFKVSEIVKTKESPINGAMVDSNKADRHPLAVMVENHPDARPQSGLDKAQIVYEAITEGGITRFMGIFGAFDAQEIGPVRSARTFFVDWASEYSAYYAHAGGAKDALAVISKSNVFDLPHTQGYFERINRGAVDSEHTLYTSTNKLYELAKAKKYPENSGFESLTYKDEKAQNNRGTISSIRIPFSTDSYQVDWIYNKENNEYLRSMGGVVHKDRISGNQLKAKAVAVIQVISSPIALEGAKPTFKLTTISSGKAWIFQDGEKIEAAWKKEAQNKPTKFYDQSGKEISLNRGTRWIEVIHPGIEITVQSTSESATT